MPTKKKVATKSKSPAAKKPTYQQSSACRGRPFKPGQSGNPAGRSKGSKNYKTLAIEEMLEDLGCNPIEGMVELAQDVNTETSIRAKLYCELANYLFPKRKAVELKHQGHETFPELIDRLRAKRDLVDTSHGVE